MKKLLCIILVTIILLSSAIYEVIQVNNILSSLNYNIEEVYPSFSENKDNISILSENVSNIKNQWNKNEDSLCLMFSHKDLSLITDSLTKLEVYTKENDYINALAELTLLKEYAGKSKHVMGFNIHNVL